MFSDIHTPGFWREIQMCLPPVWTDSRKLLLFLATYALSTIGKNGRKVYRYSRTPPTRRAQQWDTQQRVPHASGVRRYDLSDLHRQGALLCALVCCSLL